MAVLVFVAVCGPSLVVEHGLSHPTAHGILLDQGLSHGPKPRPCLNCQRHSSFRSVSILTLRDTGTKSYPTSAMANFFYHFLPGSSVSSVARSCPTLCDPMDCSMPGPPVHRQLLELTQTRVHRVGDAIQPSHPLSSPLLLPSSSQHQGLFR